MVLEVRYKGEPLEAGTLLRKTAEIDLVLGNGKKTKPIDGTELTDDPLYEHYAFHADPGQEPLRVDKFLMNRIEYATRNKINKPQKQAPL